MFPRRTTTLVSIAALGATTTLSASARAFCREVTVAPAAGYDPVLTGCFSPTLNPQIDGGVFALYWKSLCVEYSLDQRASAQVTLDQATQLAAKAFGAWSGSMCAGGGSPSINAVDEGPSACNLVQFNKRQGNQHVITFRDDGWPYQDSSNTLGLTTLTVRLSTGEIYDADMEINSHDFILTTNGATDGGASPDGGGGDTFDLLGILTHEAGHFLGLAHSDDASAAMYALYIPAPGPLTADDVAGICATDPPDGTRPTSAGNTLASACDPTPLNGFSTQCGTQELDAGVPSAPAALPSTRGCSFVPSRSLGALELGLVGAIGMGTIVRRRRRLRAAAAAIGISIAAVGASMASTRDAQASVSIAVLFDELVGGASAVAVVTPIEQRAKWENGRIFTYTRVRVDAVVVGELKGEVALVRTMGGAVDDIGQIVEGEAALAVGRPSLLFLRPRVEADSGVPTGDYVVAARAQGQFSIVVGPDKKARLSAAGAGALLPPSPARIARVAQARSPREPLRFARDVLHERLLEDAEREIAAAWAQRYANAK